MTPAALLTQWARLLLGSLRRAGIRDVVISPGSRSTPFTWAALQDPELRCRSITDERAAAFFALGQARITARPTLLICTSGSAAANYHPAVVEADRAAIPLLALTADRPLELQHAEAPQTIDQTRLFGDHARAFFELGAPDAADAMLRAVVRIAAQAVHRALSPRPGPVQLNARARKPLDPVEPGDDDDRALAARVGSLLEAGPPAARAAVLEPAADDVESLARELAGARRPVIALGPMAPWQAPDPELTGRLARATGSVVFAEAASQLRFRGASCDGADALDTLLRAPAFRAAFRPDVVLELGPPPVSTGWREWLAGGPPVRRHVVWPHGWSDPHGTAAGVWSVAPDRLVRALAARLGGGSSAADGDEGGGWRAWLRAARDAAWSATDSLLGGEALHEGAAVRAALAALPAGSCLVLGNSLPIRHPDGFCPATDRGITVLSQRGAAGIDGLVAGAAGSAAASGAPTLLVLGDVSLLHDVGGLAAARPLTAPLAILVLDNGGGRIFDQLPLARTGAVAPEAWRFWVTPPELDLEAAAETFGLRHAVAASAPEVGDAVAAALAAPGATVIRAAITGEAAELQRGIVAEVERRVAALPPPT